MEHENRESINVLLFEVLERICRFFFHIRQIGTQFEHSRTKSVHDKLSFLTSYEQVLSTQLQFAMNAFALVQHNHLHKEIVQLLTKILIDLKQLHVELLAHLPRPLEPVELRRFSRLINRHLLDLRDMHASVPDARTISIYVTEDIGETVFHADPLVAYRNKRLAPQLGALNAARKTADLPPLSDEVVHSEATSSAMHITIPRIDASNPCRWPSLLHEVAHILLKTPFPNPGELEADFFGQLTATQKDEVKTLQNRIELESWLIECWCDAFATIAIGPAFWFSQFSAFIFSNPSPTAIEPTHPPALFRLKIISKLLSHRYPTLQFEDLTKRIKERERLLAWLEESGGSGFTIDEELVVLFSLFQQYFLKSFFKTELNSVGVNNQELNKRLQVLVKYTEQIDPNVILELVGDLAAGLPIPSATVPEVGPLCERPTSLQEVLLAGWLYRVGELRDRVIGLLQSSSIPAQPPLLERLLENFQRFDQAILRSIQVGEWFYALKPSSRESGGDFALSTEGQDGNKQGAYLVDWQIAALLKEKRFRISPLIEVAEQLGANSIDIRLGTSFQAYYQNQSGVVDFVDGDKSGNTTLSSRAIDLDYLESITISPNQFLLGHSLEYLQLPEDVCGFLEGRSSFARLGLEIHMTAGFVDPGFKGTLTLELFNGGPNPIRLYPGFRIAQMRLSSLVKPRKSYNQRINAKYSGQLFHNTSRQFCDPEVDRIRRELRELNGGVK